MHRGRKYMLVIVSPGGLHYEDEFRSLDTAMRSAMNEIDNGSKIDQFYEADSRGNMIRSIAPQWIGAYRRTGVLGPWASGDVTSKVHL